jgi:hypothetical protein
MYLYHCVNAVSPNLGTGDLIPGGHGQERGSGNRALGNATSHPTFVEREITTGARAAELYFMSCSCEHADISRFQYDEDPSTTSAESCFRSG